jgi:ABC-type sugar transport system substrate-binding protein
MGLIVILAAVAMMAGACVPETDSIQTSVIVTAVPSPEQTPEPPAPQPVTLIPQDFLPGLSETGVIPTGAHHIGIIVSEAEFGISERKTLEMICAAYQERFDVLITAQICANAAQQQAAAEAMAASGIELLIIAPVSDDEPGGISGLCEQQGIPYITMGMRLNSAPGQGGYICAIEHDDYLAGVLNGISIVQAMTAKYGQPRGNIAELTGVVSDEASIMRSRGLRRVLDAHDKLRVVCSVAGGDDAAAYAAAVNILKAYRAGELDGIVAVDDAAALQVLQAVLNYDRTELLGAIWTTGGTAEGLAGVWYGQFAQTVEHTAFSGMMAIEYALQYLRGYGDDIPPVVTAVTRVFSADSDAHKDGIAVLITQLDEMGAVRCVESVGDYALFKPDAALLGQYYPTPWYELGEGYLSELDPYTTQEAIYAARADSNTTEQLTE